MKHLKKGRKFGRERNQRRALMRNLASSFFVSGRIVTTEAKAKELRPFVEKIITRARSSAPADRRIVASTLPQAASRRAHDLAKSFVGRNGGYTRIIKTGIRKSDSARMAIIELVK